MQAERHIWKTADGELVAADNPKAATLVYAPGDEVEPKHEDKVTELSGTESASGSDGQDGEGQQASQSTKQGEKPVDKSAKRGGDK